MTSSCLRRSCLPPSSSSGRLSACCRARQRRPAHRLSSSSDTGRLQPTAHPRQEDRPPLPRRPWWRQQRPLRLPHGRSAALRQRQQPHRAPPPRPRRAPRLSARARPSSLAGSTRLCFIFDVFVPSRRARLAKRVLLGVALSWLAHCLSGPRLVCLQGCTSRLAGRCAGPSARLCPCDGRPRPHLERQRDGVVRSKAGGTPARP